MSLFSEHEMLEILKKVTIFASVGDSGLKRLIDECPIVQFRAEDVIIREGTPATDIYIILQGSVRIILNMAHEPFEICEFSEGNCIGEASVIGILNHSASAVAIHDCTMLVLSRKTLMNIFEADKEFFSYLILNIARELARRLHHTDEILLHYTRNRTCH